MIIQIRMPVVCRNVIPQVSIIIVCDKQLISGRGDRMTQAVTQALVVLWEPSQTLCSYTIVAFSSGASPLLTQGCENHKKLNLAHVCKLVWKPQLWRVSNFSPGQNEHQFILNLSMNTVYQTVIFINLNSLIPLKISTILSFFSNQPMCSKPIKGSTCAMITQISFPQ